MKHQPKTEKPKEPEKESRETAHTYGIAKVEKPVMREYGEAGIQLVNGYIEYHNLLKKFKFVYGKKEVKKDGA